MSKKPLPRTRREILTAGAAGLAGLSLYGRFARSVLAAPANEIAVKPAVIAGGLAGLGAGHLLMRARFERRLGGYTGDCLGAVQQTSEIGFLLGVLACL